MERFRFIFLALITIIIFSMCQDDVLNDSELDKQISDLAKDSQGRNNYNLVDSMLIPPNETQLNDLWQDMMLKANVNEIGGFLYENGLFNWEYAHLLKQYSHDEYIISIPTIHNDSIYSILYAGKVAGTYNYWHVSLDDLMLPTDDLINNLGMDNALTSIFSFLNYEQNIGDYNHKFLFRHLLDERFANKISEIELRGWCLLEVVLYHNDIESSQDDPCPCYYYNKLTGHQMFGVPKNFDPAKDDPTWIDWHPAQEYLYSITPTGVGTGSIIHGQDIEEEGYTVYHFWAWCPDDISQDPWQYNWVTNTQTITGGGDLPTGSHWDYDYGRWTEDVKDCMFAFDDPRITEKINKVESDLITSSCGEAAEFNIKLIIDQLLLRLCETYYENLDGSEGGPPSNIGYGFDETVTSIMTEIDKSVHYEIGQRICDVCGETNDPEACIEDMDSCPPEAYEACVEDKLCDYAIGNFEIDNEILLDQEAKDLIKSKVSSCGSEGFEEEVLDILFTEYFSRIKSDKILDLEELFEDCFGEPNEFGDYIDCENSGNSIFEFTLYADQPVENSRDMYDGFPGFDLDVGHAFVSLKTNYGGSDKSLTYGFYPSQKVVLAIPLSPQDICDDSNHSFTSSVTIQISCDDFNQAISTSISAASNDYHLINYNCTDYAIEIANAVSLGVADTQGSVWFGGKPYGALSNPGDLGEDIKLVPNGIINPYGGNAPGNSCN